MRLLLPLLTIFHYSYFWQFFTIPTSDNLPVFLLLTICHYSCTSDTSFTILTTDNFTSHFWQSFIIPSSDNHSLLPLKASSIATPSNHSLSVTSRILLLVLLHTVTNATTKNLSLCLLFNITLPTIIRHLYYSTSLYLLFYINLPTILHLLTYYSTSLYLLFYITLSTILHHFTYRSTYCFYTTNHWACTCCWAAISQAVGTSVWPRLPERQ